MDLWRTVSNHRCHHQHHHKPSHCRVIQVLWGTLLIHENSSCYRMSGGNWGQETGSRLGSWELRLPAFGKLCNLWFAHLWGEEAGPQSPRVTVFCYFRNASGFRSSFVPFKKASQFTNCNLKVLLILKNSLAFFFVLWKIRAAAAHKASSLYL